MFRGIRLTSEQVRTGHETVQCSVYYEIYLEKLHFAEMAEFCFPEQRVYRERKISDLNNSCKQRQEPELQWVEQIRGKKHEGSDLFVELCGSESISECHI